MTRNTRVGLSLLPGITNSSVQSGGCFPDSTPLPKAHAHLNYNTLRQHRSDFMRWEASKLLLVLLLFH